MKITTYPVKKSSAIVHIYCPKCGEKLRNFAVSEGATVKNASFRCKRCCELVGIDIEPDNKK